MTFMPKRRVYKLITTVHRTNHWRYGTFHFLKMIYLVNKTYIRFYMCVSFLLYLCDSAVLGIWDLSLPGAGVPIWDFIWLSESQLDTGKQSLTGSQFLLLLSNKPPLRCREVRFFSFLCCCCSVVRSAHSAKHNALITWAHPHSSRHAGDSGTCVIKLFFMVTLLHVFILMLQKMEAAYYDNIIEQQRIEPEFFRMGFYGRKFPFFLRVRFLLYIYIYILCPYTDLICNCAEWQVKQHILSMSFFNILNYKEVVFYFKLHNSASSKQLFSFSFCRTRSLSVAVMTMSVSRTSSKGCWENFHKPSPCSTLINRTTPSCRAMLSVSMCSLCRDT